MGGGGVLRISSDRVDRIIFLGLKFSISEFFWGRKLLASIFWSEVGIFWGYSELLFLLFVLYHLMLSEHIYG